MLLFPLRPRTSILLLIHPRVKPHRTHNPCETTNPWASKDPTCAATQDRCWQPKANPRGTKGLPIASITMGRRPILRATCYRDPCRFIPTAQSRRDGRDQGPDAPKGQTQVALGGAKRNPGSRGARTAAPWKGARTGEFVCFVRPFQGGSIWVRLDPGVPLRSTPGYLRAPFQGARDEPSRTLANPLCVFVPSWREMRAIGSGCVKTL